MLAPPRPGYSFPQKQTLTYAVDWRVFPAGTAVIHFEQAGDRERIAASADTIGAINMLFHVADRFQSDFDREKGCTYDFDKQTVEGRRLPVVDAMSTVLVTMKIEGSEEIKTPLGTFKTLRVQPTADAGVVKNRGNIWIWYTDDERHLPVQMRARLFWGTITFRLIGNENK